MDDIGKALVMIGHILLFIVACTTSLYLYNKTMKHIDMIFLSKDYSNQGDSIVGSQAESETRKISRAEIILAIVELKNMPTGYKVIVKKGPSTITYTYDEATNSIKTGPTTYYTHGSQLLYETLKLRYNQSDVYELVDYTETYLKYEKI